MKKGFTLAELIAVIVILALISLITVPIVSKMLKTNKKSLCNTQLNEILTAARSYGSENIFRLPDKSGDTLTITLGDLINGGYIDGDITNPVSKETFDPDAVEITITKNNKKYEYELDNTTKNACEED